ncbi:MAG: hypothetical protein JO030_04095 [Candidatus Eremiobacteraeota bacterium]|nr:hypothetical protein [Candidatus Eremiobacteraeota bacterium]
MSKDPLDKTADAVKKVADNVRDSVHEAGHRSNAEGERVKRETLGDSMTPGEKAGSAVNEAKERVQAEFDKGKRDLRDKR